MTVQVDASVPCATTAQDVADIDCGGNSGSECDAGDGCDGGGEAAVEGGAEVGSEGSSDPDGDKVG